MDWSLANAKRTSNDLDQRSADGATRRFWRRNDLRGFRDIV